MSYFEHLPAVRYQARYQPNGDLERLLRVLLDAQRMAADPGRTRTHRARLRTRGRLSGLRTGRLPDQHL